MKYTIFSLAEGGFMIEGNNNLLNHATEHILTFLKKN
jgi:hypothetical protein